MGDLLRQVHDHPGAGIVGICDADPARMATAIAAFGLSGGQVFSTVAACLATQPDMVIPCPVTADDATFVEQVVGHTRPILLEKPFAATLADADRTIAACARHGTRLAINWPPAWYPPHITTKRMIDGGQIGQVCEVRFCDGNRRPLCHLADKVQVSREEVERQKPGSWWYKAASCGGSLPDCLDTGAAIVGPLDPATARTGQRIVDTAFASAKAGRTLPPVG